MKPLQIEMSAFGSYAGAETVDFEGKYLRHDIGRRALAAMEEQ